MTTLKDKIDEYVNDLYDDIYDDAKWKYRDKLRAAFRDVVEQVVKEMTGKEEVYIWEETRRDTVNWDTIKSKLYAKQLGEFDGRNWRIAEEQATGENIIKSLE